MSRQHEAITTVSVEKGRLLAGNGENGGVSPSTVWDRPGAAPALLSFSAALKRFTMVDHGKPL
jgi:hypothetical protein